MGTLSWWSWALIVGYGTVATFWKVIHLFLGMYRRKVKFLNRQSPQLSSPPHPRVSVLIAARDEEQHIGSCLDSVLALDWPDLEVFVVDDRSTDGTGRVISRYAEREPRVRSMRLVDLPPGWAGKAHAIQQAARRASGQWLLITDADTRHMPENLRVMMQFARRHRADMVSLLPQIECRTFWEHVMQPAISLVLGIWFPVILVNRTRHKEYAFANGQYILIRREVFEAVGGMSPQRNQMTADVNLARAVKGHGFRIKVASATDLSVTRMYPSLRAIVRGWGRIFYGAWDGRPARPVITILGIIVLCLSAYLVLAAALCLRLTGHAPALATMLIPMSLAHILFQIAAMWRVYGYMNCDRRYAPLHMLGAAGVVAIMVRALYNGWTRRVSWRDTTYDRTPDAGVKAAA